MIAIQRYLRVFAAIDLVLFFAVVIGSSITERYICHGEPIDVPYVEEYLQISSHQNHNKTTEEHDATQTNSHKSIWDFRIEFLNRAKDYSTEAYHILHISIWAIFVAYIVVEIWLYCVLIIGITSKQIKSCRKWLAWRTIILAAVLVACGYEVFTFHQITCTGAIVLPYGVVRLFMAFAVIEFMTHLKRSSSTDTVVMTGSEKL